MAWMLLRSIRLSLLRISDELRVPMPGDLLNLAQAVEPVGNDRYMGYPVDETMIHTWTKAVSALRDDADAPLPAMIGDEVPERRASPTAEPGKRAGGVLNAARPAACARAL